LRKVLKVIVMGSARPHTAATVAQIAVPAQAASSSFSERSDRARARHNTTDANAHAAAM
jgi:hypothetical protein